MKRDTRFLIWHNVRADIEVDDPDECDCWLGELWDIAPDAVTAERIYAKHPVSLEKQQ